MSFRLFPSWISGGSSHRTQLSTCHHPSGQLSTCLLPCNVQVALQPQQCRMNNVGQFNRLNRLNRSQWTKCDCIHHPSSSIIIHHPSSSIIDVQKFSPRNSKIIAPNGAPRLADIAPLSMQTIQEFLVLRLRTCSFGELWVSQRFSLRTCHQQLTNNDNRIFPKALRRRRSFSFFSETQEHKQANAHRGIPGWSRRNGPTSKAKNWLQTMETSRYGHIVM